jgi:hypothetical protein
MTTTPANLQRREMEIGAGAPESACSLLFDQWHRRQLLKMSNSYCFPGRAGGFPDFVKERAGIRQVTSRSMHIMRLKS